MSPQTDVGNFVNNILYVAPQKKSHEVK